MLIGTLLMAYALISGHAFAALVAHAPADQPRVEAPCHEEGGPPPVQLLLCKHHCLTDVQTLDHPEARVPARSAGADLPQPYAVFVPRAVVPAAIAPHGGAPPPPRERVYASTARLRI